MVFKLINSDSSTIEPYSVFSKLDLRRTAMYVHTNDILISDNNEKYIVTNCVIKYNDNSKSIKDKIIKEFYIKKYENS